VISVVIPVRNGGEDLRRCLDGIAAQRLDEPHEVVVVDSSSTDGSAELAREKGARLHVIPAEEFNHGATRNLGAELAGGEVLVFTSQDAYPEHERWLAELVAPLRENGDVAGSYGRQLPHEDATPPERYFLDFLYGPHPREQRAAGEEELSMETTLFSNVNAAMRRTAWERFPFAENIIMSEDQEWARRALLAGHALRYVPGAAVRHSHPYTIGSAFRRFFDSGASADRAYLAGARPSARVLRRAAVRYARGELAWLWRTGRRRWIPYTAVYELAKFAGLQLGVRHPSIPRPVIRRLSALPEYWSIPAPAHPWTQWALPWASPRARERVQHAWESLPRARDLRRPRTYRDGLRLHRRLYREGYTMLYPLRGRMLFALARRAQLDGVPGALVDCGTWNGGSTALLSAGAPDREVWAFDSFQGLPAPTGRDLPVVITDEIIAAVEGGCLGSESLLREAVALYGRADGLQVRPGWFSDTLPGAAAEIGTIAVLHCDSDLYDSVRLTLEELYGSVSPGGCVVIDDYGAIPGARQATDDFRRDHGIRAPLVTIDQTGRYWVRP